LIWNRQAILCASERIFSDHTFDDPSQHEVITSPMPQPEVYENRKKECKEYEGNFFGLKTTTFEPILLPEQERHIFRLYNYRKFLAKKYVLEKSPNKAVFEWDEAINARNMLTLSNVRLIKRQCGRVDRIEAKEELASHLMYELIRLVDQFNWTLGFRFNALSSMSRSAYAFLKRGGGKSVKESGKKDEHNEPLYFHDNSGIENSELSAAVRYLMNVSLDPLKIEIIERYFGFEGHMPKTFRELSKELPKKISKQGAILQYQRAIEWMQEALKSNTLPLCILDSLYDHQINT
jgi:hypothetical protein